MNKLCCCVDGWEWGWGVVELEQSKASYPTIHFDYRYVLTKVGSNLTPIFKRFF